MATANKSPHWTQTPKGRKHMAKMAKARRLKREARNGTEETSLPENELSYAFGYVSAWIEVYADAIGVSRSVVTHRLADLLYRKARR